MRDVDLVVIGATPAGVSVAMDAADAGVERIVLVDTGTGTLPSLESHPQLEVVAGTPDVTAGDASVVVKAGDEELRAKAAVVLQDEIGMAPELAVPSALDGRVGAALPEPAWGRDVLVVGGSERAAETAIRLAEVGANVVLARGNLAGSRLSRLTRTALLLKEAERRLTILWHSRPAAVTEVDGEPLVAFDDVRTPDLLFDHVVLVDDCSPGDDVGEGPVWDVSDVRLAPGRAWERIRTTTFADLPGAAVVEEDDEERIERLRNQHYNATITHFHRTHSDLWLIRVQPDHGDISFQAGQYASLGLGYWEPRVDAARDRDLERKRENLVRRSYSISSPVFDDNGYLHDSARSSALEFYIVLVPPSGDHVPGLTPRLALCAPGDRIYVGPRIVGRYTLAPVRDPSATVVMLATGTGEAPHNAMAAELLRKGHHGPIVSVVCVRYRADLAYLDVHQRLQDRFANYHYLPLVTREQDEEKLYIQDVIGRDMLADRFGVQLDPETAHVFLCGNPAMIGIPGWEDDQPVFPETTGVCQLLHEKGFDLDRHGHVGNVHTEKYW